MAEITTGLQKVTACALIRCFENNKEDIGPVSLSSPLTHYSSRYLEKLATATVVQHFFINRLFNNRAVSCFGDIFCAKVMDVPAFFACFFPAFVAD